MSRTTTLSHKFVNNIPETLDEGALYVSMEFATVAHLCCCGCGNEVFTPLNPTDWSLAFDGKSISLDPSVGNWGLECNSHYWIENNRVIWSRQWSEKEIAAGRLKDQRAKEKYFAETSEATESASEDNERSLWQKIKGWFRI